MEQNSYCDYFESINLDRKKYLKCRGYPFLHRRLCKITLELRYSKMVLTYCSCENPFVCKVATHVPFIMHVCFHIYIYAYAYATDIGKKSSCHKEHYFSLRHLYIAITVHPCQWMTVQIQPTYIINHVCEVIEIGWIVPMDVCFHMYSFLCQRTNPMAKFQNLRWSGYG